MCVVLKLFELFEEWLQHALLRAAALGGSRYDR